MILNDPLLSFVSHLVTDLELSNQDTRCTYKNLIRQNLHQTMTASNKVLTLKYIPFIVYTTRYGYNEINRNNYLVLCKYTYTSQQKKRYMALETVCQGKRNLPNCLMSIHC